MKLFFINKKYFEELFDNDFDLTRRIHIEAFNELKQSISINNSIPLVLTPSYDSDGVCLFDFVNKRGDIYFYQFTTTAK